MISAPAFDTLGSMVSLLEAASLTPSAAIGLLPGAEINERFTIVSRVGIGGMGVVYRAHDRALQRDVAIKLRAFSSDRKRQDQMLREAVIMARLSHPNVVSVYDVGFHGGDIFIVMELVEGVTLRAWQRARPRTRREIVSVFLDAGKGLAALHRAALVHRDFKPDNVMVGADGRVLIADLGLGGDELAPEETSAGTPAYMAPEQSAGARVDARADIYAFCVALHEALTGRRPAGDGDLDQALPPRLRRILERGLRAAPAERYPTLEPLLADLACDPGRQSRRVLGGVAVLACFGLLAAGLIPRHDARAACEAVHRDLTGIWDRDRRQAIAAAFVATGAPGAGAAWQTAERTLDAYARRWLALDADACVAARVRHELSEEALDLRVSCLLDRLQDLRGLTRSFLDADSEVVVRAPAAAASLPDLGTCSDDRTLRARWAPVCSLDVPAGGRCVRRVETVHISVIDARFTALVSWPDACAGVAGDCTAGAPEVLGYRSDDGTAALFAIAADGTPRERGRFTFPAGWTQVVALGRDADRRPRLLGYSSEGRGALGELDPAAGGWRFADLTLPTDVTAIIPVEGRDPPALLFYHGGTGATELATIAGDRIELRPGSTWRPGWTGLTWLGGDEPPALVAYAADTGTIAVYRFDAGGHATPIHRGAWTPGWSAFAHFVVRGAPYTVSYKAGSGRLSVDRFKDDGEYETVLETVRPTGHTHLVSLTMKGRPHELAYHAGTGELFVDRIDP